MHPSASPFPLGWYSFDLPGRPCNGTYCLTPYATLPPIDESELRGEFQWLPPLPEAEQAAQALYDRPEAESAIAPNLAKLKAAAAQLGLQLPPAFLRFMAAPKLQDSIPSCTACYFALSPTIHPSPVGDGGYFIRFLNDQQDVLLWYLYLTPQGDHAVVVSPYFLDYPYPSEDEPEEQPDPQALREIFFFCAPDFEHFIYRFWLENTAWFGANTPAHQRYLEHYRQHPLPPLPEED